MSAYCVRACKIKHFPNGNFREFFLWRGEFCVFKTGIPGGPGLIDRCYLLYFSNTCTNNFASNSRCEAYILQLNVDWFYSTHVYSNNFHCAKILDINETLYHAAYPESFNCFNMLMKNSYVWDSMRVNDWQFTCINVKNCSLYKC